MLGITLVRVKLTQLISNRFKTIHPQQISNRFKAIHLKNFKQQMFAQAFFFVLNFQYPFLKALVLPRAKKTENTLKFPAFFSKTEITTKTNTHGPVT